MVSLSNNTVSAVTCHHGFSVNSTVSAPVVMAEQVIGALKSEGDLWVSAGQSYSVPVFVGSPGTTLCWEFSTRPKVGYHQKQDGNDNF